MKIFIAYKFSGEVSREQLKENLTRLADALELSGHETYIHFRDAEKWGKINLSPDEIIHGALNELKNCDAILALVMTAEKSEGLLLEVGFAIAGNKKIILAIKKDTQAIFLRALADEIIEYENTDSLVAKVKRF